MSPAQTPPVADADPYAWLEAVEDEKSLAWVRERNALSRRALEAWPAFGSTRDRLREVLDARDRIPGVTRRGGWLYNFWQDAQNPRGVWRRTTLEQYRLAEPRWDILLDVDALGRTESVNWVFMGARCDGPGDGRCLLSLSRGGADAVEVREFDLGSRRFVKDGFVLPESKATVAWADRDTLLVSSAADPGGATDSGYGRVVRRWARGTAFERAPVMHEVDKTDLALSPAVDRTPGFEMTILQRSIDFYRNELWVLDRHTGGKLEKVPKPIDAELGFWYGRALLQLRSAWTVDGRTWPAGSLLVTDALALRAGKPRLSALFTPTPTRSLESYTVTRGTVLLNIMEHVAGRLQEWRPVRQDEREHWVSRDVDAPFPGNVSAMAWHDPEVPDDPLGEAYALSYTDFLTPDTLYLARTGTDVRERLKARPAQFDATGMRAEQRFATSRDGTKVPYFVVWPRAGTDEGPRPTLLYGYGGFEVSMQPGYSGVMGRGWTTRGGVLVVANIRGGGEYGPAWHQVAVKGGRQKSFDDFAAVAEDLIRIGVTTPRQLGIMGGSNGGLLVGSVMLQRPELFGAVVCQVPLLDMRRYHKLLAGASWMAEYGDPDQADDWAWLSRYSPYQNVRAGQKLPPLLLITSTRDDRVHPGHARKMAARMLEQGHRVDYYENIEGGHGGAADNAQRADMNALEFAFLWQHLGEGRQRLPATPSREASK